jgi:hypothetical protein
MSFNSASCWKRELLLKARDGDAQSLPRGAALLKRNVVEPPAPHQDTLKFPLLLRRRLAFVLVRLA